MAMEAMKRIANPESVLKMNSDVLTAGVYDRCGGVMESIIVKIKAMKTIVISLVVQKSSTAKTATFVYSMSGNVTVCSIQFNNFIYILK